MNAAEMKPQKKIEAFPEKVYLEILRVLIDIEVARRSVAASCGFGSVVAHSVCSSFPEAQPVISNKDYEC